MNQASDISAWRQLLDSLLGETDSDGKVTLIQAITIEILTQLSKIFQHLPSQPIPRLQKDYKACVVKSDLFIENLFDNIDLSDKPLLCSAMELCIAYGNFRLAQITYHIGPSQSREPMTIEPSEQHAYPTIVKTKWYNMSPILPEAGTIGWKNIMNHGLVREEPRLMQSCLRLLIHKLHFYSVIRLMEKFQNYSEVIKKNGEKVVEKLLELIRDVAYEDERVIGIDSFTYNLLTQFFDDDKQASIIDAIIQDLFKPYFFQEHECPTRIDELYSVVDDCIMCRPNLQELLIHKLVDNLKCNIIRRKRRYNVEATLEGGAMIEGIISDILNGVKPTDFIIKANDVNTPSKSLQTRYIDYWCAVLNRIVSYKTLTAQTCILVFGVCCTLLCSLNNSLSEDMIKSISILAAKLIENTGASKIEKVLKQYDDSYMIEFTKINSKTSLLTDPTSPVRLIYISYMQRQLMFCLLRNSQAEMDRLSNYIAHICSCPNMSKDVARELQYISVTEFARFNVKNRGSKRFQDVRLQCSRACSEKLYKFIKKNSMWREHNTSEENLSEEAGDKSISNGCSHDNQAYATAIDALVSILRVSISCEDKDILDRYSDLMLRLYHLARSRLEKIVEACKKGASCGDHPIDVHLPKLTALYAEHSELIGGYLNYDLIEIIALLLMESESDDELSGLSKTAKLEKKSIYNQLKSNLNKLEERAKAFPAVYQTVINKQYAPIVEQSLASFARAQDIKKEKPCCHKYLKHMEIIGETSAIVLNNCTFDIYRQVMVRALESLDNCDPLNHSKMMYIFLVIENLIPISTARMDDNSPILLLFKESMPKISCNLIRMSKTVELGPSIHAFVKSGSHKTNLAIQCCTYSSCIKLYTQIFMRFPPRLTNQLLTDAMQISISANLIQYAHYSTRLYKFFIQLASSMVSLLKAICIGKKEDDILKSSMPIFLSVLSLIIRCIIIASDRQKLEKPQNISNVKELPTQNGTSSGENGIDDETNNEMIHASREYKIQLRFLVIDVCRVLNSLSFLRVKMVDYAPNLISTYIKDIQRAACPDEFRTQLNEGVFRLFNLVDAYQQERQVNIIESGIQRKTAAGRASGSLFEMIHARLDQASREIFREMHETYSKFHRYVGKC